MLEKSVLCAIRGFQIQCALTSSAVFGLRISGFFLISDFGLRIFCLVLFILFILSKSLILSFPPLRLLCSPPTLD